MVRGQNAMGSTTGGMAVIAGGGKVHTTQSCLTVDAALIHLHRLAIENLVFFSQIEVFVTASTGFVEVKWIDPRFLVGRGQDVVPPMTVRTDRDVLSGRGV